MFTALKKLLSRSARTSTVAVRKRRYQPLVESLEDRQLMTTASLAGGILSIVGTNNAETITVRQQNNVISISGVAQTFNTAVVPQSGNGFTAGAGPVGTDIVVNTQFPMFVQAIEIDGRGGADIINLNTATQTGKIIYSTITLPTAIHGGGGGDTINGGGGRDFIFGEGGLDTLNGRGGDDVLEGGASADTLAGGGGSDRYVFSGGTLGSDTISEPLANGAKDRLDFTSFIGAINLDLAVTTAQTVRASHLTLTISNNTLVEEVLGSAFGDTIKGNSRDNLLVGRDGNDTLLGRGGDDYLRGVDGNDTLNGGAGRDRLYGGDNTDTLIGGTGDDGMFGGKGADTVTGGSGNDRFLSWKSSVNSVGYRFDPDTFTDIGFEDVKINFENSTDDYVRDGGEWGWDDDITYNAQAWNQNEIERVDQALAELHERTGNTKLLKTSLGFDMTFIRHGSPDKPDGGLLGSNGSGTIRLFDGAFDAGFEPLMATVIHEIGHNWDEENPNWQDFKDLSGWTQVRMSGVEGWSRTEAYGDVWYFWTDAEFATGYASNHPVDDFAESFAAYFLDRAGWAGGGAENIPGKIQFIDNWLETL